MVKWPLAYEGKINQKEGKDYVEGVKEGHQRYLRGGVGTFVVVWNVLVLLINLLQQNE